MNRPDMKAWTGHMDACAHCKQKCFYGRVGGGNRVTIARSLCEVGRPLYEAFIKESDKMAADLTKGLVKDMAKTLGPTFTMDELLEKVQKPGDGPMDKLHNHEVKEAAWGLLDDGVFENDGKGNLKVKE